jgi:ribosomal protein S18 acetylase RimI-like enzyme
VALIVREAKGGEDLAAVRELFLEYGAGLGIDLSFQDFESEVASLPGDYQPPTGALLLAELDGCPVGCVAMRPWNGEAAEMKRLFVRPAGRGTGAGRALAGAVIERARRAGYRSMRLDTLPTMTAARRLYESLGFREIAPYRFNPIPGTTFLELAL